VGVSGGEVGGRGSGWAVAAIICKRGERCVWVGFGGGISGVGSRRRELEEPVFGCDGVGILSGGWLCDDLVRMGVGVDDAGVKEGGRGRVGRGGGVGDDGDMSLVAGVVILEEGAVGIGFVVVDGLELLAVQKVFELGARATGVVGNKVVGGYGEAELAADEVGQAGAAHFLGFGGVGVRQW